MKKTILITILIALSIGAFGQTNAKSGLRVGNYKVSGSNITLLDSIAKINDKIYFFIGADTGSLGVLASDIVDLFDIALKKYADTTHVTTVEFRPQLTDIWNRINCYNATQTKVFLPPDSTVNFPIGAGFNFRVSHATAIVTFYPGTDVVLRAAKDTLSIKVQWEYGTVIKSAANTWDIIIPH